MIGECRCGLPTSGAWLCEDCTKTLAYSIPNVAAYYEDLGTVATKRARYSSQGATKSAIGKAQPLPVDHRFVTASGLQEGQQGRPTLAPGAQLRWDAWNTIVAWCRVVMEDQPERHGPACRDCIHISCTAIRRKRWPRNTLRSMCAYLDRQFRWIIREEWAPDFLDEMLDIERRLCWFVDRPPDRWYAGKCSADLGEGALCQAEIYATVSRGATTCRACGTEHDIAKRRDFLLDEAKDILVTATEAANALIAWTDYDGSTVKLVDLIRKWRDHPDNPLEVQDVTSLHGKDRHLYRLGDIQDRLVVHAQRQQARHLRSA